MSCCCCCWGPPMRDRARDRVPDWKIRSLDMDHLYRFGDVFRDRPWVLYGSLLMCDSRPCGRSSSANAAACASRPVAAVGPSIVDLASGVLSPESFRSVSWPCPAPSSACGLDQSVSRMLNPPPMEKLTSIPTTRRCSGNTGEKRRSQPSLTGIRSHDSQIDANGMAPSMASRRPHVSSCLTTRPASLNSSRLIRRS